MQINQNIYGFSIKRIRKVEEIQAQIIEMIHDRTGLELCWLNRAEENKTFGIAFKTLPWDDTGVFHILEHSLLGGSKKYPVKEPFLELMKSSMNTFLNAMTFPDKTVFPVSSKNHKDFVNLVRVYLDGVFCPLIHDKEEIFLQEGWHLELSEDNEWNYKGVVYNEMKGALASADAQEEKEIQKMLYPDSPLGYIAGGNPESIPNLTYDTFKETHRKFYSPSNGKIFLDGNIDIEEILKIIDDEYLKEAEPGESIKNPPVQAPIDSGCLYKSYELGEDENLDNKTRIAWGRGIGGYADSQKTVAMHILADVLCGSNHAILNREIIGSDLAEDMNFSIYDGTFETWAILEAQNITDGCESKVESKVFDVLQNLVEKGIDLVQIEASIASYEFMARERDYDTMPLGIVFGLQMLDHWMYGGDPIDGLVIGTMFDELRNKAKEGYFEKLIKEILIDNKHRCMLVLKPSSTFGIEKREEEKARIDAHVSKLGSSGVKNAIKLQKSLIEWQCSEDLPEELEKLPHLDISDIKPNLEKYSTEVEFVNGVRTLYHAYNCNGIANFSLYFECNDLQQDEISLLSFLTDILGKLPTKKFSCEDIDIATRLYFGGLGFYVSSHGKLESADEYSIKLATSFCLLESNMDVGMKYVAEILKDTDFDAEEAESIAIDVVRQLCTEYYYDFVESGSEMAKGRLMAQRSAIGAIHEASGGFNYYYWLKNLASDWDWNELKSSLKALVHKLVCGNRLTISLTSENKSLLCKGALYFGEVFGGTATIRELSAQYGSGLKPILVQREGVVIPSDIAFACAASVLDGFHGYTGHMSVASKIISLDYLWNVIRVQGGAYGTGFRIDDIGLALAHSISDPNAVVSFEAYKHMGEFLREFVNSGVDYGGYIISTVADSMQVMTPKAMGMRADDCFWQGISHEYREKLITEVLKTDAEDLMAIAEMIGKAFEKPGICVVGGEAQIEMCELDYINNI